jgi:hypothetical protein
MTDPMNLPCSTEYNYPQEFMIHPQMGESGIGFTGPPHTMAFPAMDVPNPTPTEMIAGAPDWVNDVPRVQVTGNIPRPEQRTSIDSAPPNTGRSGSRRGGRGGRRGAM